MPVPEQLSFRAVAWPEVRAGDDLGAMVSAIEGLRDGDIVLVTSKVVSKAEGRLVYGDRPAAIAGETRRVVARRGATVIAETWHGLVMAAAGVDASNTPIGTALLLPDDPDASARALRLQVQAETGLNVAVIVTDTAGRAWRLGQADIAIGCAGLAPLLDLTGTQDTHGNELLVTTPAVADELAAAADLVKGKATGQPVAIARGLAHLVLPPGDPGAGAVGLVRGPTDDMFGLGVREAVSAAANRDDPVALDRFPRLVPGDADPFATLVDGVLRSLGGPERGQVGATLARIRCPEAPGGWGWRLEVVVPDDAATGTLVAVGRLLERADVIAAGHRLVPHEPPWAGGPGSWRPIAARCWHAD